MATRAICLNKLNDLKAVRHAALQGPGRLGPSLVSTVAAVLGVSSTLRKARVGFGLMLPKP